MLVQAPTLDGRRARLDVPSLHGVDLNLDRFNLDEPMRTGVPAAAATAELVGAALPKAFWASLEGDADGVFAAKDKALLREIFNPCLSDRRDEGEHFTPPDPSSEYVERLRALVKREEKVRQQRREHFFSSQFAASEPGPLFPCSWTPTCEVSLEAQVCGGHLRPRPDYVAQAGMFKHIMESSVPVFDKATEDGLRFRMYKAGNLDIRTTQEHSGQETVGAVFSVLPAEQGTQSQKSVQDHEKVVKATEYVEAASAMQNVAYRRSYIVLATEDGHQILTEKLISGVVAWVEDPEDIEDRNSLAKVIRSGACSLSMKSAVTVGDMKAQRSLAETGPAGSGSGPHSASKRYAQSIFSRARGLLGRRSSGFGSKAAWRKGDQAKNIQKEARKEKLRAEINKRTAAEREMNAKLSTGKGKKVIDPVIVGSWDDWTYGEPMAYDEESSCYTADLQMGSADQENFQILCDNDWDLCLHPNQDKAGPSKNGALCGPDREGHGKNWTIGSSEEHSGQSVIYRIVLKVDGAGYAEAVAWDRLGQP